jgi:hypothetical protein
MDTIQAHKILNEVKEGIWHSQNDIVRALVTTGDIDVRCFKLDSAALSRGADSPDCHSLSCQLPSMEG